MLTEFFNAVFGSSEHDRIAEIKADGGSAMGGPGMWRHTKLSRRDQAILDRDYRRAQGRRASQASS